MFGVIRSATAVAALAIGVAAHSAPADAALFMFDSATHGNFGAPNDIAIFSFTVASPGPSSVTIQTFNYQGPSPTGGFDTNLALFDSGGNIISDGASNNPNPNPMQIVNLFNINPGSPDFNFDARITGNLNAGTYFVTLTQFDNIFDSGVLFQNAVFTRSNDPNYPMNAFSCRSQYTDERCDAETTIVRENAWKIGIDGVASAAFVPLPAALPLLATALAGLGFVGWRRRRYQQASVN